VGRGRWAQNTKKGKSKKKKKLKTRGRSEQSGGDINNRISLTVTESSAINHTAGSEVLYFLS
jgi:hypothetical protein